MISVFLLLSLTGYAAVGNIMNDELNDSSIDGEVAMKNLEAAQVKMEQKLESMTNFIDQELQKAKDSPVEERYSRRKRSVEEDPLLKIPQEDIQEILYAMTHLKTSFDELQDAFLGSKARQENSAVQLTQEEVKQPVEAETNTEAVYEEPSEVEDENVETTEAGDENVEPIEVEDNIGAEDVQLYEAEGEQVAGDVEAVEEPAATDYNSVGNKGKHRRGRKHGKKGKRGKNRQQWRRLK